MMSQTNEKNCPNTTTLADYLLGQLEPPTLDECESHIIDCDTCHETLRGLRAEDTLSEHVADALFQSTASDSFAADLDESDHVRGLVDRLLRQTGARTNGPLPATADPEILADRAAEVLRCVEPDPSNQTLGSIGNYQLTRLIGAGSTGVVFQAIDQKLDRTVALKVLRPSLGSVARERFIAEARLAASIEHPNVVTIYQIDQVDRLAFIAMQWLPGQTLETKLLLAATMAERDVRRIAAEVAAGLQAAHQRQLVHRDIKPANVWISDNDGVKILDFGLARVVDDDIGLTATGMLAGTPSFMSPEQTKGHELDGRSDLFSLGCMIYRMATGKFAFGATSILGTLQSIQHEQPTPPKMVNTDISNDLSDLTMSLLEKQPANRPESAAQVVTMLESERRQWPMKIAGYESTHSGSEHESQLKPKSNRQRFAGRWWAFIAASLLGLAGWYFSPQIIRIATDQGELVIESDDKDVEVQILQGGQVVHVLDTKTKNSFNIESGEYQIKAAGEGNSFEVTPNSLTMKRGHQTVVSVTKGQSTTQPTDSADINDGTVGDTSAKQANQANLFKAENSLGKEHPKTLQLSEAHNEPTYKGKPFAHWINIAATERSKDMLFDALRAGTALAETADEKAKLLEVARTLARKFKTSRSNSGGNQDQYWEALIATMRTFDSQKVVQFVLTELEQGTPKSVAFCGFLVAPDFTRKQSLKKELVEQAPELLRRIVVQLEREQDRSATYVLDSLGYLLREGVENQGQPNFDHVAQIREQNKEIAPLIRQLFLESSASTKCQLVLLTRDYWPNDEQIELALQTDVFDPTTPSSIRSRLFGAIADGNDRYSRSLGLSPEPFRLLFLQKLLDNQSGPTAQRMKFQGLEEFTATLRDFSSELTGSTSRSQTTRTIEGRPAMMYHILNSLMNIATVRNIPPRNSSRSNSKRSLRSQPNDDHEKLTPFLEQILEIETTEDPELKADLENMKTLLVFENAKTLLDAIKTRQIFENAKPLPGTSNQATYKDKPFSDWINISSATQSNERLIDALKAGAELTKTTQEKAALLEFVRTLARKHGNGLFVPRTRDDSSLPKQYRRAMNVVMYKFEPKEIVQFILTELEHGNYTSLEFCASIIPTPVIAEEASRYSAMIEQAPELLRRIIRRMERVNANVVNRIDRRYPRYYEQFFFSLTNSLLSSRHGILDPTLVAHVKKQNKKLAPTIRELFLKSSATTKYHLIRLTRAYGQNDEQVELALQAEVFSPSTSPNLRDGLYEAIAGEISRRSRSTSQSRDLDSSPESFSLLFLQKLLDNQLGPNSQRIQFNALEEMKTDRFRKEGRLRYFSDDFGMGPRRDAWKRNANKVFEGRPAMVFQILDSLMSIATEPIANGNEKLVRLRESDSNKELDHEKIKVILKKILAIETTEDTELLADIENLKTLLIFENAKTLLDRITKPPADSPSPEPSSSGASNPATYKGKTFSHWINIATTERDSSLLRSALIAAAKLADTVQEKEGLLEVTRTLARKDKTP